MRVCSLFKPAPIRTPYGGDIRMNRKGPIQPLSSFDKKGLTHIIALSLLVIAFLLFFSDKAFHIDDPVYIWVAKQIVKNPFDFYGFTQNWGGTEESATIFMKNPPAVSYLLAAAGYLWGWSERALHIALILPALAATIGTYLLAKRFTKNPWLAALLSVITPVFMLSSTTVMCDILMLAFWCWAVLLWLHGIEREKPSSLMLSGILISLSALSKYFGVSLIPLLTIYTVLCGRKYWKYLIWMLLPIAILIGYQWYTHVIYGKGLLLDAVIYAGDARSSANNGIFEKILIGLSFVGGCIITALFFAPFLWRRAALVVGIGAIAATVVILVKLERLGSAGLIWQGETRWGFIAQAAVFIVTGLSILFLSASDLNRRRDADSFLLFSWVFGTFIFAVFFNWTVSARSVLPIAPAASILMVRKLETPGGRIPLSGVLTGLVPSLLITFLVMYADYRHAGSAREAARNILERFSSKDSTLWFQGHWGFQYYMEEGGAKAVDFVRSVPVHGDIIVVPANNTNTRELSADFTTVLDNIRITPFKWMSTMNHEAGSGFYASESGPLPYILGVAKEEAYIVFEVK